MKASMLSVENSPSTREQPPFAAARICRVCGSKDLSDLLFLGEQPLANSLKDSPDAAELTVPLSLVFCPESSLVQIRETVRKEILFSQYVWVSGTSPTTRRYAQSLAEKIIQRVSLKTDDLVVEIASNDGTFLKPFVEKGFHHVLGVDPAGNIAELANHEGIKTLPKFWNRRVAEEIRSECGVARVILARNVIAHVSELHDVMSGIEHLLASDGVGAVEFHYAGDILDGRQYDSIYHEHLCYFSLKSFGALLRSFQFFPFHVDTSPISGGAVVVYFSKNRQTPTPTYNKLVQQEVRTGVNTLKCWAAFAKACERHRVASRHLVSKLSDSKIVGFGASARSSTYLNYCGFDHKHIRAVIDNNPLKQGKYTPGSGIPIVSFEEGLALSPDTIFIFAWNFRDEIIRRCRKAGFRGAFMTAFPNRPKLLTGQS